MAIILGKLATILCGDLNKLELISSSEVSSKIFQIVPIHIMFKPGAVFWSSYGRKLIETLTSIRSKCNVALASRHDLRKSFKNIFS